jgi:hypothetical protein
MHQQEKSSRWDICYYRSTCSLFVWLVVDGLCWFVLRKKYCWLVADKPSEQRDGDDSSLHAPALPAIEWIVVMCVMCHRCVVEAASGAVRCPPPCRNRLLSGRCRPSRGKRSGVEWEWKWEDTTASPPNGLRVMDLPPHSYQTIKWGAFGKLGLFNRTNYLVTMTNFHEN